MQYTHFVELFGVLIETFQVKHSAQDLSCGSTQKIPAFIIQLSGMDLYENREVGIVLPLTLSSNTFWRSMWSLLSILF